MTQLLPTKSHRVLSNLWKNRLNRWSFYKSYLIQACDKLKNTLYKFAAAGCAIKNSQVWRRSDKTTIAVHAVSRAVLQKSWHHDFITTVEARRKCNLPRNAPINAGEVWRSEGKYQVNHKEESKWNGPRRKSDTAKPVLFSASTSNYSNWKRRRVPN